MIDETLIVERLRTIQDPELGKDLVSLGFITGVEIKGAEVNVHLLLDTLDCPFSNSFVNQIKQTLLQIEGIKRVDVSLKAGTKLERPDKGSLPDGQIGHLNHAEKVIAVMSGKGGVGKSLVTGLLAVYLQRAGMRVGVLDADITGPSLPKMFFNERPMPVYSPRAILPAQTASGIKLMSINLILPNESDPVVWRGPIIANTIRQFWSDTLWGELDYLLVDLPPGTSDAPLTALQSLPMSGVLMVTSPQDLAGLVVKKAANMVRKVGVPLLGLVENMGFFRAPDTGTEYEIFGPSHAEETALAIGEILVARLPINPAYAVLCDSGKIEEIDMPEFEDVLAWIETVTPPCQPPKMPSKN
ncbi:MAG: Mrp/NBP35 family ATP-binding protein [Anaerolineae bacterium]|nr:Mrp/NBP35 family ATP-binding protein [Anaerolineae bacterium]